MIRKGSTLLHTPAVWLPDDLSAAWNIKQQLGEEAPFIAGGTLLQTNWIKTKVIPPHIISLEQLTALHGVNQEPVDGTIRIGAATTLASCWKDLSLHQAAPLLREAIRSIAAPAIRNKATLGGNIGGGVGDTLPALLVMDAKLALYNGKDIQVKALVDYLLERESLADSILVEVQLPEQEATEGEHYFYKKLGYREAFTPSIVTVSGYFQLNAKKKLEQIRLAVVGSMTRPQRLIRSEQVLVDATLNNEQLSTLFQTIYSEIETATDPFSTAAYKKTVAANLIVSELARLVS